MFISIELSGCNQISNVFLTDQKRLVGTWISEEMLLDGPTTVVFFSNGTLESTIDFFDFKTTIDGTWLMNEGILTIELQNWGSLSNYTYKFSEDSTVLTLTSVNSTDSFLLQKQVET